MIKQTSSQSLRFMNWLSASHRYDITTYFYCWIEGPSFSTTSFINDLEALSSTQKKSIRLFFAVALLHAAASNSQPRGLEYILLCNGNSKEVSRF